MLIFFPPVVIGQIETDEPVPPPELEGVSGVLPELDELPFLAIPYQPPELPADPVEGPRYRLPSAARFLPPRAVPVPATRFHSFSLDGNTVFDDTELASCVESFRNRDILLEDLDQIRFEISRLYISRGYINSGATIPEQDFRDGNLNIWIVEGRLTDVIPRGNKGLTNRYLSSRILVDQERPLHFPTLQQRLQVLQGNPNILRLNAELKPGLVPGEALMAIEVQEAPKWSYGLDFQNQRSPSVGGEQAEVWFENRNLSGYSDLLRARLGLFSGDISDLESAGVSNYALLYQRPLLADDTTLILGGSGQDYSILEEPFQDLSIKGESQVIFGGFRRPIYRSLENEVWLSVLLESSHDETTVLGRPFSISPGSVNGELDLTVLRFGQDWTRRTRESALSLRSIISIGIDAWDSTEQLEEPDGEFTTFLLESQYSKRIDERGDILVLRGGLGLTTDPLPPPAQFRLGGFYTVRGYRENLLVSDNGIYGGIDFQIPLISDEQIPNWNLWFVPFVDGGIGWDDGISGSESLMSVGFGFRLNYKDWFRGEIFYGIPLTSQPDRLDDLQDQGIHFRMSLARF